MKQALCEFHTFRMKQPEMTMIGTFCLSFYCLLLDLTPFKENSI